MREYLEPHSRFEQKKEEQVALVGFDYRYHEMIRERHGGQLAFQDVILNPSQTPQGEWCLESLV
jgi:CopG family nickel-responsive transcriptional regulator